MLKIEISFSNSASLILLSVCYFQPLYGQSNGSQTHTFRQMYDSVDGIGMYDKFNPMTGGDSIRKFPDGHLCNNWIEDYYPDGKLLHKGFYTDGKLSLYTNYYPDGKKERVFKPVSERKNEMKKYYPDKKLKSDVLYYDGNSIFWQDYYENGKPSYIEEYDKSHEKLLKRCSYYSDGKPESLFLPVDTDKLHLKYSHKEYFPNGQLKEGYGMMYKNNSFDFVKNGDDKEYDEKGNLVAEYDYVDGTINEKIK